MAAAQLQGIMLRTFCARAMATIVAAFFLVGASAQSLRIPTFTAYLDQDNGGARVSEEQGVSDWRNPATRILWFGELKQPGAIEAAVELRLPEKQISKLRLTVAGQSHEVEVAGLGGSATTARFGSFVVAKPGYQQFTLESLNPSGATAGVIAALVLSGPAAEGAHFNLKERRNAASVHLSYPVPSGVNVAAFYCEMTGLEDPEHTYYMACGWHRGYFGMQVNSPAERRVIFSVWDSGGEAVDRAKVGDENRVKLMGKGEGVYTGDFGNEGTGGHSHLKFPWKTGELQRFLVTAQPASETITIFSGYYFRPDQQAWMLISSWRAPKEGGWMRGLYSFSENFVGENGHLRRKALYGNQWIRTDAGEWIELTTARFSHDPTGKEDRLDRFMGLENGQFFLSHGGFLEGFTKAGEIFSRSAGGRPPLVELPPARP